MKGAYLFSSIGPTTVLVPSQPVLMNSLYNQYLKAKKKKKRSHTLQNGDFGFPSIEELEDLLHGGQLSLHLCGTSLILIYGLWRLGITHVLNAAHGKMCCKGRDDFYGTTVKYYGVPANDLPTFDISSFFYPSAHYIHDAFSTTGAKVFVHCAVGVSRSAALVLAYLMIYCNYSLVDAILKVKERRWIFPNRGFLKQLISLNNELNYKVQSNQDGPVRVICDYWPRHFI
uniref:Dual specificity protein phosphatase n=1 Tax=Cyprinus carpio TaxID=7962 RepID=A0A8C1V1Z4_CYPCA